MNEEHQMMASSSFDHACAGSSTETKGESGCTRVLKLDMKFKTKQQPAPTNSMCLQEIHKKSDDKASPLVNEEESPLNSAPSTATTFPHEPMTEIRGVNIEFDDLRYTTRRGIIRRETKHILKGVTGDFRAGELSALIGPSGAGKSTLLNILSGYIAFGYEGRIKLNGRRRQIANFKRNIAFITQDTSLQPFLSVNEAMYFATNLKIGQRLNHKAKWERINKILEAIGMLENGATPTGQLSGGQKKRLAIALELINNPPVLMLDEPTSGLDSSTSYQCISLLKSLATEGRTVICTIHQPSALVFELFDHFYAMANGECIYSGSNRNLLPFLASLGLPCPESYSLTDYLMEIATGDYGSQNHKLVQEINNGRNMNYRKETVSSNINEESNSSMEDSCSSQQRNTVKFLVPNSPDESVHSENPFDYKNALTKDYSSGSTSTNNKTKRFQGCRQTAGNKVYGTPFHRQLRILLLRTFLLLWRDKSLTCIRFGTNLVTAFIIGFLYYNIGNDAGNALNSFRYCFYSIMFIMYTAFSSILVKFPLELPIVSREHFNRWYSLKAYYLAITLADIPIQLICTVTYITITYKLTNQPPELFRLLLFCAVVFLTALVGQSIGLMIGASLDIKLAAILGPFLICPFLTFSGFFLQEKDTPHGLKWLFSTSFLKYSFDGSIVSIFGFNRTRLECHDIYCHYSRPKVFLRDVDMLGANYSTAITFLVVLFVVLRIVTFYIMSFRLRLFR